MADSNHQLFIVKSNDGRTVHLSAFHALLKDAESFEVVIDGLPPAQINDLSLKAGCLIRWSPDTLSYYVIEPDSDERRRECEIVRQRMAARPDIEDDNEHVLFVLATAKGYHNRTPNNSRVSSALPRYENTRSANSAILTDEVDAVRTLPSDGTCDPLLRGEDETKRIGFKDWRAEMGLPSVKPEDWSHAEWTRAASVWAKFEYAKAVGPRPEVRTIFGGVVRGAARGITKWVHKVAANTIGQAAEFRRIRNERTSEAQRSEFQSRPENHELCRLAEELCQGQHFLDLASDEQLTVRRLRDEQDEQDRHSARRAAESADIAARSACEDRKRLDREERAVRGQRQKAERRSHKRGKSYSKLLPNLQFDPSALERIGALEENNTSLPIEEKLGLMNAGQVVYRDSISGTEPKVYEAKAGDGYRIYFYQKGPKLYIRLVGDKGTQDADLEQLRR